jgi:putative tryptophan/tyrosine transport system substrate-binding protein
MRRREFIALLAGAAPVAQAARAQRGKAPVIGVLHPGSPPDPWFEGFLQGLRELGYVDGQNARVDFRWGERRADLLDSHARELVASKVDVLVIMTGPAVRAALRHTTTIPIVMGVSGDPAGLGVIASLARPGGNVTGLSFMSGDLAGLRLSVLKEAVPQARRVAVLYNATEPPTAQEMQETDAAARTLGLSLVPLETRTSDALTQAFANAAEAKADALITFAHGFAFVNRRRIIELAAQHRLPAMYGWREFAEDGGLMSYGPNVGTMLRRAATFVDRVIKGANPAEMPIEQPTRFELVVNLKTASALGLDLPPALMTRADEVIE